MLLGSWGARPNCYSAATINAGHTYPQSTTTPYANGSESLDHEAGGTRRLN